MYYVFRKFRFRLRTLFAIIVVSSAWLALYVQGTAERQGAHNVTGSKSLAIYDFRLDGSGYIAAKPMAPLPDCLNMLIGGPRFVHVEHVELNACDGVDAVYLLASMPKVRRVLLVGPEFNDRHLSSVASHPSVVEISLVNTMVTDSGIAALFRIKKNIRLLNLTGAQITNDGLSGARDLKQLKCLILSSTAITDSSLEALGTLDQLEQLYLSDTRVTDAGMIYLEKLSRLHVMALAGTSVSAPAAKRLQRSLPKCTIIR